MKKRIMIFLRKMDDFIRNIRTWMEMLTAGQAQGLCLAGTSMIQDIIRGDK